MNKIEERKKNQMKTIIGIVIGIALSAVAWLASATWTGNKIVETATTSCSILSKQMNAEHAALAANTDKCFSKLDEKFEKQLAISERIDKKLGFLCKLAAECRVVSEEK